MISRRLFDVPLAVIFTVIFLVLLVLAVSPQRVIAQTPEEADLAARMAALEAMLRNFNNGTDNAFFTVSPPAAQPPEQIKFEAGMATLYALARKLTDSKRSNPFYAQSLDKLYHQKYDQLFSSRQEVKNWLCRLNVIGEAEKLDKCLWKEKDGCLDAVVGICHGVGAVTYVLVFEKTDVMLKVLASIEPFSWLQFNGRFTDDKAMAEMLAAKFYDESITLIRVIP